MAVMYVCVCGGLANKYAGQVKNWTTDLNESAEQINEPLNRALELVARAT